MSEHGVIICGSQEDNAFIAEVPELPGCAPMVLPNKPPSRTWTSSSRSGSKPRRNLADQFLSPRAGWCLPERSDIERIAMLRDGIKDIRLFYENDVRILKQF